MVRIDRTFGRDIRGVTMVEYAIISALIVTTAVYSFAYFADALKTMLERVGTSIAS